MANVLTWKKLALFMALGALTGAMGGTVASRSGQSVHTPLEEAAIVWLQVRAGQSVFDTPRSATKGASILAETLWASVAAAASKDRAETSSLCRDVGIDGCERETFKATAAELGR